MKNELVIKEEDIKNKIYHIRGKDVMLDSDLAKLYKCKNGTKVINQAVNRNRERFPEDFYFRLTKEEYENLKSQIVTSSWNDYGGVRKLPFVFTEQGCIMLSSVLKTQVASQMSVIITRAFILMKHYIFDNVIDNKYVNNMLLKHDSQIEKIKSDIKLLQESFDGFSEKESILLFEGQIFEANELILNILKKAKKEIIIIDNYADYNTLNLTKKIKSKVTIITNSNYITDIDLEKYNKEYHNVLLIRNNLFHDRYIILDKKDIYLLGSSINNIGSKISTIVKIEEEELKILLLNKIGVIINI